MRSLTLRDPWGSIARSPEPTHLWFTIGGASAFTVDQ